MPRPPYKILTSHQGPESLAAEVVAHIAEGYVPLGGASVAGEGIHRTYAQAVALPVVAAVEQEIFGHRVVEKRGAVEVQTGLGVGDDNRPLGFRVGKFADLGRPVVPPRNMPAWFNRASRDPLDLQPMTSCAPGEAEPSDAPAESVNVKLIDQEETKTIRHLDVVSGKEETTRIVRDAGKLVSVTRVTVEAPTTPPAPLEPMVAPRSPVASAPVEIAKVECPVCAGDGKNRNGKACWRCHGAKVVPDPLLYPETVPTADDAS